MEYVMLRNGVEMPIIGYGTLQIQPDVVESCVIDALQAGYRLIDTAAAYHNERGIGQALSKSKIDRSQLFITSKVWVQDSGYENTMKAFFKTLENLQLDYLDLYLIHQPYGDYYGSWKALETLYQRGLIKAIGVCNFWAERYVDFVMNVKIAPMINQVECHPFYQQRDLQALINSYDGKFQAWGPLNEGQKDIFHHPIILAIANFHHKSVAQVILRWHMQNGRIAIPKTIHLERMKENIDIFDFTLRKQDMQAIDDLDIGYSEILNQQSYTTAKWLNAYKIHD